jgi:hypothetical protein
MTRTGKIARLPRDIREELNRRLQDGVPGNELVTWLNSLKKVNAVLKKEFNNQPISPQNLSEWNAGGYQEWLDQQETKEFAAHLADEADELNAAGLLHTDKIAIWLTARLMAMLRRLAAANTDDDARWKLLGDAAAAFAALRRGDHSAERLKIARERLDLERGELDPDEIEKLALKWAEEHNYVPSPLTPEEREQRYREILGLSDPDDATSPQATPVDPLPSESNLIKPNQT